MPMEYDFMGIEGSSGDIAAQAQYIRSTLEEGEGAIKNLAGIWEGDASMSWQAAHNQWQQNSNEMNEALHNLSAAIGDAGHTMAQTNKMVGNSFTSG